MTNAQVRPLPPTRVASVVGYRGECGCRWFGALRGVPLAAEFDIAEHMKLTHLSAPATSSSAEEADRG